MIERMFSNARIEFRAMPGSDSPGMLSGYAAVWRSVSLDLGGFREMVAPNAFDASLQRRDEVAALVNHDPNRILGRTRNKTLALAPDYRGLGFTVALPDTSLGRDTAALVARGDLSQCSFAFVCDDESWGETEDPDNPGEMVSLRTIKSAKLLDVSVVANPAYAATSVGVQHSSIADGTGPLADISGLARSHFPEGLPMEVRSRIFGSTPSNPRAAERRRRILSLFL